MLPAEPFIDLQPVVRGEERKDGVVPCDAGVKGFVEEVQGVIKDVPQFLLRVAAHIRTSYSSSSQGSSPISSQVTP